MWAVDLFVDTHCFATPAATPVVTPVRAANRSAGAVQQVWKYGGRGHLCPVTAFLAEEVFEALDRRLLDPVRVSTSLSNSLSTQLDT